MFEYGALFGESFTDLMGQSFTSLIQFLSDISPLWYLGGVILFIAFVRMLNNNRVAKK